jgi:methyltransferase
LSLAAFLLLLAVVGLLRLVELRVSRRHQRLLLERGATFVRDPNFRWMVLFHTGVLLGAGLEVLLLHRRLYLALAVPMFTIFLAANIVRWWVIRTLGEHWSVRVMDATRLGVVTAGPFRYVRHPNYAAVFVEMLALPLICTAWITALVGTCVHVWVLRQRLAAEDPVLLANPEYRAAMAGKPKFFPPS